MSETGVELVDFDVQGEGIIRETSIIFHSCVLASCIFAQFDLTEIRVLNYNDEIQGIAYSVAFIIGHT